MAVIRALLVCSLVLSALTSPIALCAEYTLMPSPATVHIGNFNAALKPVLTINSGDIVTIEAAATAIEPEAVDQSGVVQPSVVPDYTRAILREVKDRGPGRHILTGPIAICGTIPGDVLEVRILAVDLAVDYGFNRQRPYEGALPDEFPKYFERIIAINREARTAEIAPGVVIPLTAPFFGTMGVAPPPGGWRALIEIKSPLDFRSGLLSFVRDTAGRRHGGDRSRVHRGELSR